MATKKFTSKRGADITSPTQTVDLSSVSIDDAKALMLERVASAEEEAKSKFDADVKARGEARNLALVAWDALGGGAAGGV
jgi:hypothetical protein